MNAFWGEFLGQLLLAVAPVLAGALTLYVLRMAQRVRNQMRQEQYLLLTWLAETVVQAAEQAGAAGLIEDKKSWAMAQAERWLWEYGIRVDGEALEAAIESAVWSAINKYKAAAEQ